MNLAKGGYLGVVHNYTALSSPTVRFCLFFFWLCWVLVGAHGLSLTAVQRLVIAVSRLLYLWHAGSRALAQ